MNSANETRLAIARITDTGHFEQLATAVLRAATPETYANLVHSGTNEVGKPVKSPVDGIGFIPGAKPRHMVVAHHTTSSRDVLARKWLYNPETAKAQKAGKPKTPAGDVLKAIELARQEREHSPNLEVTLALTSNTEPTEDLIRNTARIAESHNIHIDIWSGSRIAGFLDNDPNGQWIRSRFLGIDQERLSEELLRHLSRQSVTANAPPVAVHDQIARDGADRLIDSLPRPVGLLVSPSGYGKSVACHQYMQRTILQGGLALVLSHSILEESLIPETAIDAALRQLHPKLEPYVGQRALALATPENPVVLVVEDVSKSGQLALIMDRLLKWSAAASSKDNTVRWRIICPVWPELLATLSHHSQRELQSLSRLLGPFSPDEARAAVLKRATSIGLHLTPLDADVLATRLANDPLLIGLQDLRTSPDPINVIRDFVLHSLQRVAKTKGRVATDYLTALRAMSSAMLRSRILDPAWNDILCWLSDSPDHLQSIRELIHHAEIVQTRELTTTGELLQFRHDRVRHWLLSDSVLQAMLQNCLEDVVLREPYFADIVGAALAEPTAPKEVVHRAAAESPLSLFYALQRFGEPTGAVHHEVLSELQQWLAVPDAHTRAFRSLRYAALSVLAETQSSYVVRLLTCIAETSWAGDLAGLRNGELRSGLELCRHLEPGAGAWWRDLAVEHAVARFGPRLTQELADLLTEGQLSSKEVSATLRLAGHVGSPALRAAIEKRWQLDATRIDHLADYLWAAAQCMTTATDSLLATVCNAWASLPDTAEKANYPSPRDSLAADQVAWAFWRRLPTPALDYFLARANDESLRWPISYMLRGLDDPKAVRHLAHYLAARSRAIESTGGTEFPSGIETHWERALWDANTSMSHKSRESLEELWSEPSNDKHLRKKAFRMWEFTSGPRDLLILPHWRDDPTLSDYVLRARLRRSDASAIPELIERIRGESPDTDYWWWSARDVWSDDLAQLLDEHLECHAGTINTDWSDASNVSHTLSDLVIRLDPLTAERLLLKHWSRLKFSSPFIHAALYHSTPGLRAPVAAVIDECSDKKRLFEHVTRHFGIFMGGHPGVKRVEQLEPLVPYLNYLTEQNLKSLYHYCSERRWYSFRRFHIDPRLRNAQGDEVSDSAGFLSQLDLELTREKGILIDHSIDRALENGETVDGLFSLLEQWLSANPTTKALDVAAEVLSHAGKRQHLSMLHKSNAPTNVKDEVFLDTAFAVFRRTLD